jgi:hypothetical protein
MKLIDSVSVLAASVPASIGLTTHKVYIESPFKFGSIMLEDLT